MRRYSDDDATASGQVALGTQRDGVLGARLELALRKDQRDDTIDDGHGHLGRRRARPRVPGVPVLGHLTDEHALGAAAAVTRKRDAEPTEDLYFSLVPEDLRVEEQPVHVEDGRSKTSSRRWGPQAASAASMASMMAGSSGSTWGRKRPMTSPFPETRNFSKFQVMSPALPSASGVAVSSS